MMPFKIILFFIILPISSYSQKQDLKLTNKKIQVILNTAKVNGVILIFDKQQNTYYSNNFKEAKERFLPASTFKIPNSIIGLETGILKNENTIFKWNGNRRYLSVWEKDLSLKEAFQQSCVPCYQELARKIGVQKMKEYLKKLKFGIMDIDHKNIDNFWLLGTSKISPFQQIDFLNRFYNRQLPISESTSKIMEKILKIKTTKNYVLNGKTGLVTDKKKSIGWFVGYLTIEKKVFFFATRISPKEKNMPRNKFISARKKITMAALKELKIIN